MGVSECNVCGGDGCSLTVVWSEVTVTCGGSVSGYVLTVTPPTSDCPDCVVVDGSSVYTLTGNETQYIINVNGSQSLVYDMTVRAETCDGGDLIEPYTANLTGIYIVRMPSFFTNQVNKFTFTLRQERLCTCTCIYTSVISPQHTCTARVSPVGSLTYFIELVDTIEVWRGRPHHFTASKLTNQGTIRLFM